MTEIKHEIQRVLKLALHEDRGFGDLTSDSIFTDEKAEGEFLSKHEGVLCGLDAISIGYRLLSDEINAFSDKSDGEFTETGEKIADFLPVSVSY